MAGIVSKLSNEHIPLSINIDLDERAFVFPAGKQITRLMISNDSTEIHFDTIYPFNQARTPPRLFSLNFGDAKEFSRQLIDTIYVARTQHALTDTMRIAINVLANGYQIKIGDLTDSTDLYLSTGCIWRVCQGILRMVDHVAPVEAQ